jgi:hypothetical protein
MDCNVGLTVRKNIQHDFDSARRDKHAINIFNINGFVHLGNVYSRLKVRTLPAESVRMSQPEPAPMDYPISHIP